jgi:single-strand DNA-binding protein
MSDTITVIGLVATIPNHVVTGDGLSITTFRLASSQRRYDKTKQEWVEVDTNWYTITTFRQLATNVVSSVQRGQRVVVTGRLRIRDWAKDDKRGTNVEIDAQAVGHDLSWGTATFTRSVAAAVAEADEAANSVESTALPEDPQPDAPEPAVTADDLAPATPF